MLFFSRITFKNRFNNMEIKIKPILFNCIDHDCVPSWCVYPIGFNGNWKVFYISHGITKWLYIDDLLLK